MLTSFTGVLQVRSISKVSLWGAPAPRSYMGVIMVEATVEKKETKKLNLKYQHDKDSQIVKGIFRFYECPGAMLSFVYRAYKEDDVERYDLQDGQVYSIPLGVARHLNKSGRYPIHAYKVNEDGTTSQHIGKKVARYGFQSLEFVDIADTEATGSDGILEVTEVL
jgi:hypothetical protein